jgi:hypothetical protein
MEQRRTSAPGCGPGDGDQVLAGVDAGHRRPERLGQTDGQPGPAGDVEHPDAGPDPDPGEESQDDIQGVVLEEARPVAGLVAPRVARRPPVVLGAGRPGGLGAGRAGEVVGRRHADSVGSRGAAVLLGS